jgi:hypothetical protein
MRRWMFGVLAIAAGATLEIARQGGPGALNTVWAEDGQVFLAQAVAAPGDALTSSYAGYYHLIPRLLAAVVAGTLKASSAAWGLSIGAAVVTAVFGLTVFTLSKVYVRSVAARLVFSAPVVVIPLSQGDVPNSIANVHWIGLYVLFWLLLSRPSTVAGQVGVVAGIVLTVGSDILAVTYVPLVAGLLWFRRDRLTVARSVAYGLALAVQLLGLLTGASQRDGLEPNPLRWLTGYVLRAVPNALFGQRWVGPSVTRTTLVWAALAWLIVLAVVVLAWRRRAAQPGQPRQAGQQPPQWTLAGLAGFHSLALYAAPVALSGVATPRYAVAPAMLLLVALVALLEPVPAQVWVLGALVLVIAAVNFRVDNPRAHGPAWLAELQHAGTACDEHRAVAIPIPPSDPGWYATLPCTYVK